MQKPLALSIAVCLGLTGCQVFKKSQTWDQVMKVRPAETTSDPDPSAAYAAKLHHTLLQEGVAHKVVTYQYRYHTHLREEAVATRTAVVYRDGISAKYPWWVKDDRIHEPVWLPNGDVNKQISFYVRKEATVLEQKDFSGSGASNKAVVAAVQPVAAPQHRLIAERGTAVTKIIPVKKAPEPAPKQLIVKVPAAKPQPIKEPVGKRTIAKAPTVKTAPAKQPIVKAPEVKKTSVTRVVAKNTVTKPSEFTESADKVTAASEPVAPKKIAGIRFRATALAPDATPAAELVPPPPIASHSGTPWTPPKELSPGQGTKGIVHEDERLEKLFLQKTGTPYNPASPGDRRTMEKLKRTAAAQE